MCFARETHTICGVQSPASHCLPEPALGWGEKNRPQRDLASPLTFTCPFLFSETQMVLLGMSRPARVQRAGRPVCLMALRSI